MTANMPANIICLHSLIKVQMFPLHYAPFYIFYSTSLQSNPNT